MRGCARRDGNQGQDISLTFAEKKGGAVKRGNEAGHYGAVRMGRR